MVSVVVMIIMVVVMTRMMMMMMIAAAEIIKLVEYTESKYPLVQILGHSQHKKLINISLNNIHSFKISLQSQTKQKENVIPQNIKKKLEANRMHVVFPRCLDE
jgi:hypothetical protein